jgi:DNA-binding transcriptional LysR family regulator
MKNDVRFLNANLLVLLDTLLRERSVTRTAQVLGLGQPAVSNSLAKLRALMEDPLLLRSGREMQLTPRAEELRADLATAVQLMQKVVELVAFDPADWRGPVRIQGTDFALALIGPPLLRIVGERAPALTLQFHSAKHYGDLDALVSGAVDLAIGFRCPLPPGCSEHPLTDANLVCIARRGHPRIRSNIGVEEYAAESHVVLSDNPDKQTQVDRRLAELGLERHVALYAAHFLSIPWIVAETDLIATTNAQTAMRVRNGLALQVLPAPVALDPATLCIQWHKRTEANPGQAWLREQLRRLFFSSAADAQGPRAADADGSVEF